MAQSSTICLRAIVIFVISSKIKADHQECRQGPCTTTPMGTARGTQVETILGDGILKKVDTYRGIPYAKPPVTDLRFSDPVPLTRWSSLIRATSYGKSCFGQIFEERGSLPEHAKMWYPADGGRGLSEDCLYLNVWRPTDRKDKMPVMVWIHGGSFVSGSSSLWAYNGQYLAAAEDVVVVSFNYRLSSFGFLKTRDGKLSGNFGMKDQQVALRWVKDNIKDFGGDTEKITLMGMSAGAASVGYHYLAQESFGLFHQAVVNSGSPFSPWAFHTVEKTFDIAKSLLKDLRCNDVDDTLKCLRALSPWAIHGVDKKTMWAPTVDGKFITDTPRNLISRGDFHSVPLLISLNKNEGTESTFSKLKDRFSANRNIKPVTLERFRSNIDLLFPGPPNPERDTVIDLYTKGIKSNGTALSLATAEAVGDQSFVCPVLRWAEDISRKTRVYFLKLNYRSSAETFPEWMGVIHGADYQWTFGIPLDRDRNYKQEEIALAEKYMKYLGNFARTGDTNDGSLPHWPPFYGRRSLCIQNDMSITTCEVGERSRDKCWRWEIILGISGSTMILPNIHAYLTLSILTYLLMNVHFK